MSYRNITVNDVQYKYAVGRTHTHVRTIGTFKNIDIGQFLDLAYCECCGEPMSILYPNEDHTTLVVRPEDVANTIKTFLSCK